MFHVNRFRFFVPLFVVGCSGSTSTTEVVRPTTPNVVVEPGGKPNGPPVTVPSTHKELAALLKQKGIDVEFAVAVVVDLPERPAAYFWIGDGAAGTRVIVYLCRDETAAKETAGAISADSFTFGRFAIGSYDGTKEAKETTKKNTRGPEGLGPSPRDVARVAAGLTLTRFWAGRLRAESAPRRVRR